MDMTGSMGRYIGQVKTNVISIIERIINECPEIDINLLSIGFRDIVDPIDENKNIDKNNVDLENAIQNLRAKCGGDEPKDVSWAMEQALDKDWKSNARFLVFLQIILTMEQNIIIMV